MWINFEKKVFEDKCLFFPDNFTPHFVKLEKSHTPSISSPTQPDQKPYIINFLYHYHLALLIILSVQKEV